MEPTSMAILQADGEQPVRRGAREAVRAQRTAESRARRGTARGKDKIEASRRGAGEPAPLAELAGIGVRADASTPVRCACREVSKRNDSQWERQRGRNQRAGRTAARVGRCRIVP